MECKTWIHSKLRRPKRDLLDQARHASQQTELSGFGLGLGQFGLRLGPGTSSGFVVGGCEGSGLEGAVREDNGGDDGPDLRLLSDV